MAKKHPPKKKRSKADEPELFAGETKDAPVSGNVTIVQQVFVTMPSVGVVDELVIEQQCLALAAEPDRITETSGNSHLLDPNRPITTDAAGVHLFFKPPLAVVAGGTYGFQFRCEYNDGATPLAAATKSDAAADAERAEAEA